MVSKDSVLNKTVKKATSRPRAYCYAVVYVYSGVPISAKLLEDYEKAEKYEKWLRSRMLHPDYDEVGVEARPDVCEGIGHSGILAEGGILS